MTHDLVLVHGPVLGDLWSKVYKVVIKTKDVVSNLNTFCQENMIVNSNF